VIGDKDWYKWKWKIVTKKLFPYNEGFEHWSRIQLANVNGSTISHKFLVTNYSALQYKVDKKIHLRQMLVSSITGCPHTPCHKFQWCPIRQ
jgi:hypothetical protein